MKRTLGHLCGAGFILGALSAPALADEDVVIHHNGGERTVRMVIDEQHDEGSHTRMCVFVPAGNEEAAGALSCSGAQFEVIELEDGGNVFFSGDDVYTEEEIERMVEDRLAEINDRLAETGELSIEFRRMAEDRAELEAEMHERLAELHERVREQDELRIELEEQAEERRAYMREVESEIRQLSAGLDDPGLSDEDRADLEDELASLVDELHEITVEDSEDRREFIMERREEAAELREEMAALQAERWARFAERMAELSMERDAFFSDEDRQHFWVGEGPHDFSHTMTFSNADGDVVVIERLESDDDRPRVVIRTTDEDLVEVIVTDRDSILLHENEEDGERGLHSLAPRRPNAPEQPSK